jgi:hypothetical protein
LKFNEVVRIKNRIRTLIFPLVTILLIFLPSNDTENIAFSSTLIQDMEYPSARGDHGWTFDSYNNVIVMFGGVHIEDGFHSLDETWLYDYAHNTWTELTLAVSPSARSGHVMVYCDVTNEIIMYGGVTTDTWSFDCESQTWSEIETDENPERRFMHSMAYDPLYNAVILFGGFGPDGFETDETWMFNCTSREWSELFPSEHPLARYGHCMVFDNSIDRIILTCGNTDQGHQLDTWAFDIGSVTWTEVDTDGNPGRLKWPLMTYDSVNQKCILFGGQIGDNVVDGTHAYDAQTSTWTELHPDPSPLGRISSELAFDPRFGVCIFFGGKNPLGGQYSDTWAYEYSSNTWTELTNLDPTTRTYTLTTPTQSTTPYTTTNTSTNEFEPPVLLAIALIVSGAAILVIVIVWILRRR